MKKRKCVTLPCVSHQQRDSHLKHPCPRSSWWHMIILLCTNLSPLSHSLCSPRVRKHKTVWAALKTIRPRAQWWWRQASVQPRGQPPWVKPRQGLSSSGALVSTCTTLNQHIPEKWLTLRLHQTQFHSLANPNVSQLTTNNSDLKGYGITCAVASPWRVSIHDLIFLHQPNLNVAK